MTERKLTRDDLRKAAEKYKNWGRWGPKDEIGTLNHTTAQDIVAAARLVRKGKVISLALNFDNHGPQGAKSKYPALITMAISLPIASTRVRVTLPTLMSVMGDSLPGTK